MDDFIKYQKEYYILEKEDLNSLIKIFYKLGDISAKGDEAVIIVQSRILLKEIIESSIEKYNKSLSQNEDKKE